MDSDPPKVHLHWIGTIASLALSALSWVGTHIGPLSGGFAILAAVWSIKASAATRRLREDQLKNPRRYSWPKDRE